MLDEKRLQQFPDGRQRAIRRCAALLQSKKQTVATVDRETLDYVVKNAGTEGAAFILGLSVDETRAKLAALRGSEPPKQRTMADRSTPSTKALAHVLTRRCTICMSTQHTTAMHDSLPRVETIRRLDGSTEHVALMRDITPPRVAPLLQRDEHLAVPLMTLPVGSRFKTPDSPDEGLRGRSGVLIYVNECRARVRFEKTASTFVAKRIDRATGEEHDVELTFERSGETDIAARTDAILLDGVTS